MKRKRMLGKKKSLLILMAAFISVATLSFNKGENSGSYKAAYYSQLNRFRNNQAKLRETIANSNLHSLKDLEKIKEQLKLARNSLKGLDFWLRYLEPIAYKKINGPLPVEWETEVFEKFERPYKREGAGLTLAAMYLDEDNGNKDSLTQLIKTSIQATETFSADSITVELSSYHHFYLCNRLFLLNLAAIYTTGFECPDTTRIIPELRLMLEEVKETYRCFNESFPATPLPEYYLQHFHKALNFVKGQPIHYSQFDHFSFIKNYINPLFRYNQKLINQYHVVTKSMVDYSLNKKEVSIFDKALYRAQNPKGIFLRVSDERSLAEIERLGKLLFYDPVLSGNNLRSCASCHKPAEYFTDTLQASSLHFNRRDHLARNTPSLINAAYHHLLMQDGKHTSLQDQTKAVITNPEEMACSEPEAMRKILSCAEYKNGLKALVKLTPQEPEISFDHIASAITFYYSRYSRFYSPFDNAVNDHTEIDANARKGFNLFMSRAQCATCHFVPQFNGVKPPYTGSEFEVLGVPEDTAFRNLNRDKGRYEVHPAGETLQAFRTGTVRNTAFTAPYMHNGVFTGLNKVIDFYDGGGGAGRGMKVHNQTLASDSLKLSSEDKNNLLTFIKSLNEKIEFEIPPQKLPLSKIKILNNRKVGGEY